MVRLILLTLFLYTGPGTTSPAQPAGTVITVTIPAVLAANTPVCAID